MRNLVCFWIVTACLLALTGCTSLFSRPPADAEPAIRPDVQTGTIEIVNRTATPIDIVLIAQCGSQEPGFSPLRGGQSIAPGASHPFTVTMGCWDVAVGVTNVGEARQRIEVETAGTIQYVIN